MNGDDPTHTRLPPASPERAGKYRIVGRIGQGGMGVVYRAVDEDLGRTVALKFIPAELGADSQAAQRFMREARAASTLDHPNIGTIFGVEETDDGRRFIVMAFYEGRSLYQRISDQTHPLTPGEALSIAVQVARGLAEAHACGVIHRDIKPSNIMITPQGSVKIVDFGLAVMSDSEQLTVVGSRLGTPAYMSPEQAKGEAVDHRSDIWSLGVVLLEMLTHDRVFRAETVTSVLYQVVHQDITALNTVEQPLRGVLGRALERDVARRYSSAADFLAALEAIAPHTVAIRPAPAARWPAASPRALAFAGAALLVAVLISGGAYYWTVLRQPAIAGAPKSADVFDKYRQAVELMKRWDKEGNLSRATTLLTEATAADPAFALGYARLAEAQRLAYALSREEAVLDAAEKNADEALRLNPELAPVQVTWGRIQALRGDNNLAMVSFERAVRIDPNDADAQLAIARQYERLGRLGDAEAAFQKAGQLDPDGLAAHDFYANFLYRQGRFADAITEWQSAIRLAPDASPVWVNLGAALLEVGRIDEAIEAGKMAMLIRPTDMGYNNLGIAYLRTGRPAEAVEAFRKAIEMSGGNYLFQGNLATSYWRLGSELQARQSFARAIELGEQTRKESPRDANVPGNLASYYARVGNAPLALQRIGTALTLAPKSPDILAGGAEVYELLGQRDKAIELAKRSMELGYSLKRLEQYSELAQLLPSLK